MLTNEQNKFIDEMFPHKGGDAQCQPSTTKLECNAEPTSNPEGSATPRTDAFYWRETGPAPVTRHANEWADFASTLERSINDFCSAMGFAVTVEDNAESAGKKMASALRKAHDLLT